MVYQLILLRTMLGYRLEDSALKTLLTWIRYQLLALHWLLVHLNTKADPAGRLAFLQWF